MSRVTIAGVGVDTLSQQEIERAIEESVKLAKRDVFAYANIHTINLARKIPPFMAFLRRAACVYCDGEGVRLGARLLGHRIPPRIALTRWVYEICSLCTNKAFTLYFLGSTEKAVRRAIERLERLYPDLRIVGYHHGYFAKQGDASDRVIESISKARPDILFVGFGMPLQEEWIAANCDRLQARVILPCGSMIDYVAGVKRMAPAWMSTHGLEWVFRLLQEPQRLWRRYLLGIPIFFIRIALQKLWPGYGQRELSS